MLVIRRRWLVLLLVIIALTIIGRFSATQPTCTGCCRVYFN